jgi:hypothetical protein
VPTVDALITAEQYKQAVNVLATLVVERMTTLREHDCMAARHSDLHLPAMAGRL